MGTVMVVWGLLPAVFVVVGLGFGELVARAAGRPLPTGLRVATGFAAYVAWASLGIVGSDVAPTVGIGAIALTAAGLALTLHRVGWRLRLPDPGSRPVIVGAISAYAVVALPFVCAGHAAFGGYGSLGDGGFQMVGASLLPDIGATTDDLGRSSIARVMQQYFADGYPAGGVLALGYPTQWLDAWSLQTFQPFQVFLLAVGALGAGALAVESGLVRGRWPALVAFAAGAAPLTAAFAMQGSVKEVGGAALFLIVAATASWAWRPLLRGEVRAAIPTGLAVAGAIGVLGPGSGPLLLAFGGLLGVVVATLTVRGEIGRRAWAGVAVAVAVAFTGAIPAVLAAVEVSSVAGSVLTAKEELGNLPASLPWWKPLAGWDSPDYRFVREFGHPAISALTAVGVGAGVLAALALAMLRRSWVFVVFIVASAVTCWYLVTIGSPWAGGKAMAIAAMTFWAAAAASIGAVGSGGSSTLRYVAAGGSVLLVSVILLTAGFAYQGVRLSPTDRFNELRSLAQVTDDAAPVLITEFDEFTKVAFAYDQPQVLGENAFAAWGLRTVDGRPTPAVKNPVNDTLEPADLKPFGWIVVRRGPASAWPPPSFRLERTTAHYWLFRRTTEKVPRIWRPALSADDASQAVSCRRIRRLGRNGFALVRASAVTLRLRNQPSFWVRREENGYVYDLRGGGYTDQSIALPVNGRYRVWVEGTFNRRMRISVDGREVAAVKAGSTNQLIEPELATGEGGIEVAAGRHTVRLKWPGNRLQPGGARSTGTVGRIWFEPATTTPRLVPANQVPCQAGRASVDWYGRW